MSHCHFKAPLPKKISPHFFRFVAGFTLVELLVVISIFSLLASVIFVNVQESRAKAQDAKKIAEVQQFRTALTLYFDDFKTYPGTPGQVYSEASSPTEYNTVMQDLVTADVLSQPLDSPDDAYTYVSGGSYACFSAYLEYGVADSVSPSPLGVNIVCSGSTCEVKYIYRDQNNDNVGVALHGYNVDNPGFTSGSKSSPTLIAMSNPTPTGEMCNVDAVVPPGGRVSWTEPCMDFVPGFEQVVDFVRAVINNADCPVQGAITECTYTWGSQEPQYLVCVE